MYVQPRQVKTSTDQATSMYTSNITNLKCKSFTKNKYN